jgi:hypothetical protein
MRYVFYDMETLFTILYWHRLEAAESVSPTTEEAAA